MSQHNQNLVADASVRLPTKHGEFILNLYRDPVDGKEHLALICGSPSAAEPPLVRVHSECFTGDVLGSSRCDCGHQLDHALTQIAAAGNGVIVYLRQEGRGIGLLEKLRAYALQDQGYDTVQANVMLGHQPDERDYRFASKILTSLGLSKVRLITNNPEKIGSLGLLGIEVMERVPSPSGVNAENRHYLQTKALKFKHILDL